MGITKDARLKIYQDLYRIISKATISDNGEVGANKKIVHVPYNGFVKDLFQEVHTSTQSITSFLHAVSVMKLFRVVNHGKKGVTIERLKSGIKVIDPKTHKPIDVVGYDLVPYIMRATCRCDKKETVPAAEEPVQAPAPAPVVTPKDFSQVRNVTILTDAELSEFGRQAAKDFEYAKNLLEDARERKMRHHNECQRRQKEQEAANIKKSRTMFLGKLKQMAKDAGVPWEELMKLDSPTN